MYIYQAELWCNDCGKAICQKLKRAGKAPENPDDESSFDSDDYPKRADEREESDTPQHCAAGKQCLNAITLPSGRKIGALFGELTPDGLAYVKNAIVEANEGMGDKEVVALWQEHFHAKGYEIC